MLSPKRQESSFRVAYMFAQLMRQVYFEAIVSNTKNIYPIKKYASRDPASYTSEES